MRNRVVSAAAALRREAGGNAAVEMGLLIAILAMMLSVAAAFGALIFQSMAVDNAVEAGVAYSASHVYAGNLGGQSSSIQHAVQVSAGLAVTAPTPTGFWGCASTSGIVDQSATCSSTATSCATICSASGLPAGYYVTVPAQYTLFGNYVLSLNALTLGSPHTILPNPLNLQTSVRVQ